MLARDYVILAVALVLASLLTGCAWIAGVEFVLTIRYTPHHPGLFLAAQIIGGFGLLRMRMWGYVMYSLLTLGMTVSCVLGFVITQQLGSSDGPPAIQYAITLLMLVAILLAIKHGWDEGD